MKKINNKGFTLLELLVALAIVSLGVMTMFAAVNSNLKINTKNDKDIKSLQIAQSEIENLRSQIKNKSLSTFNIKEYNKEKKVYEEVDRNLDELENGIEYLKIIDNEVNIYKVKLTVSKDIDKNGNSTDLYTIDVNVSSQNEDFSGKNTNLITKVFGK